MLHSLSLSLSLPQLSLTRLLPVFYFLIDYRKRFGNCAALSGPVPIPVTCLVCLSACLLARLLHFAKERNENEIGLVGERGGGQGGGESIDDLPVYLQP